MAREKHDLELLPLIEGVCAVTSGREVFAVRKADGSMAVRIAPRSGEESLFDAPLLRGMARLVRSVARPVRLFAVSREMRPQQLTRPGKRVGAAAKSLHLPALSLTAQGAALAALAFAAIFVGLPMLVDEMLRGVWSASARTATLCALRCLLLPAAVKGAFRLKFLRRTAMYRGAANKLDNCLRTGKQPDYETMMTESRLAARSDGAFLLLTALALIVAGTLLPLDLNDLLLRALARAAMAFALAGVLNELVLPLERHPESPPHRLLEWLQRPFTAEPHSEMLEVAGTAVAAARGELQELQQKD